MPELREGIMPPGVRRLRRDKRGWPVPWFVAWFGDDPDFRVMETGKMERALTERLCWVCGGRMSRLSAYVIGPMCAVNRISAEPTSHVECAKYAAQVCPFLANPKRHRQEAKPMPGGTREMAGVGILRNPGVALVWVISGRPENFMAPMGGKGRLFKIGVPVETHWYAHGRAATRAEVEESLASGLPALEAYATTPPAKRALQLQVAQARRFLPAAA